MDVQLHTSEAKEVVLDTGAGLTIHSASLISDGVSEQPLEFSFGVPHKGKANLMAILITHR